MSHNGRHTASRHRPLTVLIARFSAIGDVAMSIPVVYSVCRCNPDTRFVYLTRPTMTGLMLNAPDNLTVVGADVKHEYAGPAGLRRLFHRLRDEYRFDVFADLHDVLRTKILAMMCRLHGIPVKVIDKGRARKRALTRRHNKVMLPLVSSRARYREVFYRLGLTVEERFESLFGPDGAPAADYAAISAPKGVGETWIAVAPFAKHQGKIYPPELMEQAVAEMSAWPDTRIYLMGGGDHEQQILDGWAERMPSVTSLAGKKYGFPAELALISHVDVMVSMDSANMHLASIAGTPVVSIWGATHPYCGFKGWKQQETDMVQLSMTCRPCSVFGDKACLRGDYHCLKGIPPSLVVRKVRGVLMRSGRLPMQPVIRQQED
ncbi:MAG: glycosyltransferase family 9 protein [Pseudoflavonifractor sp.]|nr:glycosyltransferase family 9 protein [Pseudoflavonifractor sp.]